MAIIISDIFYCVRTTVVSRYSAYREDMISRRGSWRITAETGLQDFFGVLVCLEIVAPGSF